MSVSAMTAFAGSVASDDHVYLVDEGGCVHITTWLAYAQMSHDEVRGCWMYRDAAAAIARADRIWCEREGRA